MAFRQNGYETASLMQGTLEQREPRPLAIIQAREVGRPRWEGRGFEGRIRWRDSIFK